MTVQEGCDRFCTLLRRALHAWRRISRPVAKVVAEVEDLAAAGVREVTLLGQNVNAYHGRGTRRARTGRSAQLCARLAQVPGIARIRYTTSHPDDMDDELIAAHRDLPQLMPHLHLPVQAGSDSILAAMNRKHKHVDYLDLVARLRAARPDIALSSDFIVGFPGESDADFEATLDLIRKVGFASAFSFKYSPRPGTPGTEFDQQIDDSVKRERLVRLQALVETQRQAFNRKMIGATCEVLFEKAGRHPGQIAGKSPYFQAVHVEAPAHFIGEIRPVEIIATGSNSLFGRLHAAAGVGEVTA